MTDPLLKLFGSAARVKLLRLFLFNPQESYTAAEAAARARVPSRTLRKEFALFERIGLVHHSGRVRTRRYSLNEEFTHAAALQGLLLNAPARGASIAQHLRSAGTLKLLVLGGIFVGQWENRLDLLIVGDRMNEYKLRSRIRTLESEIGKELRYALLSSADFTYRLAMNDRLIRDVFDYPHRIVLDKLDVGLK